MKHTTEEISPISKSKIRAALKQMKENKVTEDDEITIELINLVRNTLLHQLKLLFNQCIAQRKAPEAWRTARAVLIHKKRQN